MARLMIIVYMMSVLFAHFNLNNSMMQARRPKRHQEEWSKMRVTHPEVHSKGGVSRPEVHSKTSVSGPEVHSKTSVSGPEVHSKAMISYQQVDSKPEVSHPKIFEKLLSLDRHSNQLEQTGSELDVKDCPADCCCRLLINLEKYIQMLDVVDCESNPIYALIKMFNSYRNLTAVRLINCHLSRLPLEIIGLPLEFVNLSKNELTEVPQELLELSQLKWLFIGYNKLRSLPAEVGNLKQLMGLWVSNNQLETLPCEIGEMTQLLILRLECNEITKLPDDITKLKKLLSITLTNNPLRKVPALPTESLVQFICSNCSIQTFACELLTEGHITNIFLPYNGIKTAADCGEINNFYVTQFALQHNSLQEIPCEYTFAVIEKTSFGNNNISTLPKNCKLLRGNRMENIWFYENKIDVLHFHSFCTEDSSGFLKYIGFELNRISIIDTSDSPLHQCFISGAVIGLKGNKLSALDSWPMLMSQNRSVTVDVSDNNLSRFTSSAGSFPPAGSYGSVFNMQRNQIKHFMDIFNGWRVIINTTEDMNTLLKNAYFDLGHNPLICDCIDYEVYRYIQTLTTRQYNNLVCDEPLSLQGQNPHHIPLINFVCYVDVKCPHGCTCMKVPHSQTINVTCRNYNQIDIPGGVPDLPKPNYDYRIDICHQHLHEISFRLYLQKANEIRLSNNSIMAIKLNSSKAFQRVKILYLDNNYLERLPESVAGMTNDTAVDIRLSGNPWLCDCEAIAMKKWIMLNLHAVKDHDFILCHSPASMVGVKVINIERSRVCPNENKTAVYVVAAISSVVLIYIVCLYIYDKLKYANWRWVGSDECDGEFKEFDVFMCACSDDADSDYVENFLIPELERRDFRVLYHREHFHPGKPIHVNMSEAFEKSKRTLAFFSNGFRESGYSMYEFHSALDLDIQNRTRRLITIKDTDLDMSKLDVSELHYFRTHTYLDRADVKFWTLLENALPRKRLGAQVRPAGY